MPEHVLLEPHNHVAVITLNNPERLNAIDSAMVSGFRDLLDRVDRDDAVRAIVVTGAGKAFCAGADIREGGIKAPPVSEHAIPRDSAGVVSLRIFRLRKPVVAAVNGAAVGFGATIILPMDLRIVTGEARFAYPFVARGITPDGASSWFLPRIVGVSTALDWMTSGRTFDAVEALQRGLAAEVTGRDQVLARAIERARELGTVASPQSAAITRQLLWTMLGAEHPAAAHRLESAALAHTRESADAKEGVAAFLEKRPPVWPTDLDRRLPSWFPWADEPPYVSLEGDPR